MTAQGKIRTVHSRVEAALRSPDSVPWRTAPAGLHDRVMASLDQEAPAEIPLELTARRYWTITALAACAAIAAGGLGLLIGAAAWRDVPTLSPLAGNGASKVAVSDASNAGQTVEMPTAVLARAFEDLKPAGSSRLVASVAAPMRSEAQGLVAETRHAARTVLSRLPFVSME